jgi:hypothetical protein
MVKLENGMVSKEDKDGDYQELLSPPQPSSPTNFTKSTAAPSSKVANGCNAEEEDSEQEPLLQKAVKKSEVLATAPKVDGHQMQNGDFTIPIFVTSDRLSVDTGKTMKFCSHS